MRVVTTPASELEVLPRRAIQELETDLGISAQDLAYALGVDKRTVDRWRAGTIPQEKARGQLAEIYALRTRLLNSFTLEGARAWLHSGSRYFGGIAPIEAIRGAGVEGVLAALEALESGAYL